MIFCVAVLRCVFYFFFRIYRYDNALLSNVRAKIAEGKITTQGKKMHTTIKKSPSVNQEVRQLERII